MMKAVALEGIGMTSKRTRMRLIQRLRDSGIVNENVLDVMMNTPRHIFVDEALAHRSYEDTALPIGHSQTISQPYIVARMTEIIVEARPKRVLELGTGSGYQSAILAQLVDDVYTVERIQPLLQRARRHFDTLKLRNIHSRHADGNVGWMEAGPFDAIIVTAAPGEIPQELLRQLRDGGIMVLPLGTTEQTLTVIQKSGNNLQQRSVEPVTFVPFLPGVIK